MSFTNPAPFGAYVTGDVIDETEINYWCSILPDCVDGAGGGTYTLSAPLILNGDDVEIESLIVTGDIELGSASGDVLTVNATAAFGADVILGSGGALTVNSTASVFTNGVTFSSTTTHTGTATFNGNVSLGNAATDVTTLTGVIAPSGTGHIRTTGLVSTGTASIDVNQYHYILLGTGATVTTTLTASNAADGDWFWLRNGSGNAQTLAGVASFSAPDGSTYMFIRVSGAFQIFLAFT